MNNNRIVLNVYFNRTRIIVNGIYQFRAAGKPMVTPANSEVSVIGKTIREMYEVTKKFTEADVYDDPSKMYWTVATGIKGWRAFAKAHECAYVIWEENESITLAYSKKQKSAYVGQDYIDAIVLPATASDDEIGGALLTIIRQVREHHPERFANSDAEQQEIHDETPRLSEVDSNSDLLTDIKESADWIVQALNSSGYKATMKIESLKEVDRFFNEQLNDALHEPVKGGLLSENLGSKLFSIGSYIGEVIISERGGKWLADDDDEEGEINIAVQLPNGSIVWPVQRVIKRCKEGPENDIYNYAAVISAKIG